MNARVAIVSLTLAALPAPAENQASVTSLSDRFADLNGVRLHYQIGGRGSAIVLLHGLGLSGAWWQSLVPHMMADHMVVVPDLRGHGLSTNPSGVYRHADVATDLLQLLDQLGIDRFSAVGHSSGAGVLLHVATRAPARVQAMMLIGLGHRVTDETLARWQQYPSFAELPPPRQEALLRHQPRGEQQVSATIGYIRKIERDDLTFHADQLARIQAHTLVVFGDRDAHPVEVALELYRAIPRAQLWIVPNQGHFPFWPDWGGSASASVELPRVVKAFLEDQKSR